MQQNRNKLLAISFTVLVAASLSLFFFTREEAKPEIDLDYFKIADTETINQVVLSHSETTVQLKFVNNGWRVNNTWDADMQMIKVLMAVLKQVEPQRPVAASKRDSIVQWLEKNGTRVTIWQGDEKKLSFLAGGNAGHTEAWFLKEGELQPFTMIIPGYRVYVAGILELEVGGWRNKRIFDFNWRNFRSLTAVYPKEPRQSFEIEMKEGFPQIKNMAGVDTAKLNTYLDEVSLLFASRYVISAQPGIDSVTALTPGVRIEIKDVASRSYVLELFTPRKQDVEVYGRVGDSTVVALPRDKVAEIVRRRDYFLEGRR